jgi:TonB family protein
MRSAWAMAFALVVASRRVHAAPDEPVFPPRAIEAGDVLYPEVATGDATVVVELLIDEKGRVQDANVLEGSLAFADAVRAAAPWWRFEPARRAGLPVVARIRMQIEFKEPPPPPPPPPEIAPPIKADDAPEEVRVAGQRTEPVVATFGTVEVRQLPGAFGDAFRAIESSPGVTPMASGLPYFFVRGAPPGNSGYFLDGIRVTSSKSSSVTPSIASTSGTTTRFGPRGK